MATLFGNYSGLYSVPIYLKGYIGTLETLSLQVGKSYRTRDGVRVQIIGKNPHDATFPFVAALPSGRLTTHGPNGRYSLNEHSPDDIVAEWQESVTKTVYLIRRPSGELETKTLSDDEGQPRPHLGKVIGKSRVTVTEGQGVTAA